MAKRKFEVHGDDRSCDAAAPHAQDLSSGPRPTAVSTTGNPSNCSAPDKESP